MGRSPNALELALFEAALAEILETEYSVPPELRHED
jgi:hypothetical protein